MNVKQIIASQKLTSSERKLVSDCNAKLKTLTELSDRYRPVREAIVDGRQSGILQAQDEAGEKFISNPTEENFRELLDAIVLSHAVAMFKPVLTDVGTRAAEAAKSGLADIADSILERVSSELDKLASDRAEAAEAAGLLAEHQAKHEAAKRDLDREREASREWPGAAAWLESHNLI